MKAVEMLRREMVKAIRRNNRVGLGTCTYIDETYSDYELADALLEDGIDSVPDAVAWACKEEHDILEMSLNASSGEADCPLVKRYDKWVEDTPRCPNYPCEEEAHPYWNLCEHHLEEDGRGDHEMECMRDARGDA